MTDDLEVESCQKMGHSKKDSQDPIGNLIDIRSLQFSEFLFLMYQQIQIKLGHSCAKLRFAILDIIELIDYFIDCLIRL